LIGLEGLVGASVGIRVVASQRCPVERLPFDEYQAARKQLGQQ
jgi:hypothetical protein